MTVTLDVEDLAILYGSVGGLVVCWQTVVLVVVGRRLRRMRRSLEGRG